MFVEFTYTRPIRAEAKPVHIEKALTLLDIRKQMNVAKKNYQFSFENGKLSV